MSFSRHLNLKKVNKAQISSTTEGHFSSGSLCGLSFEFHRVTQGLGVGQEAVAITPCLASRPQVWHRIWVWQDLSPAPGLLGMKWQKLFLCFNNDTNPQVAAHLFQAGANIVKLGIQKTRGSSPDKYLGLYWAPSNSWTYTHIIIHSFFQVFLSSFISDCLIIDIVWTSALVAKSTLPPLEYIYFTIL